MDEHELVKDAPVATLETFEHDIKAKIDRDHATAATIAAAGGTVSNDESHTSVFVWALFAICSISLAAIILIFGTKEGGFLRSQANQEPVTTKAVDTGEKVSVTFPRTFNAIGSYIPHMQKIGGTFIVQVTSYNDVYAYTSLYEDRFTEDLQDAYRINPADFESNVLQTSSSTDNTTTGDVLITTRATWQNLTKDGVNMRVLQGKNGTLVYGFLDEQTLVISNNPDVLLQVKYARMGK